MVRQHSRIGVAAHVGASGAALSHTFLSDQLPDGVSLTRASTGYRYNASGHLANSAIDAPRFDYNPSTLSKMGITVEAQSQNLLLQSTLQSNWPNGNSTWSSSYAISPDGTSNARILIANTTNGSHNTYQGASVTPGEHRTFSIYAKPNGYDYVGLSMATSSFGNGAYAYFNVATGEYVASGTWGTGVLSGYSITPCQNGWYRISVSGTQTSGTVEYYGAIIGSTAAQIPGVYWLGDGVNGISLYGAQMENGTRMSSYIATGFVASTRAAEALSFTIPSAVSRLRYVFDDNSLQNINVTAGNYTVPTNLNRTHIKRIFSY